MINNVLDEEAVHQAEEQIVLQFINQGRRMRKGKRLQAGDTIGLVAPASPVSIERIQTAIAILRRLGFRVKTGENAGKVYGGYMAGTPLERAADLHAMFADDDVRAILCLRGGYGAPQILPYLDFEWIRENPKLFIGYSDITALHIAFQQKCGLATIHGFDGGCRIYQRR